MSHTVDTQGVQPNDFDFGYTEETADQPIYATLQTLQPVDTVGETETTRISANDQYYSRDTKAVTHSQMASVVTQGITAGQYLAQESWAYYIQEDVKPDMVHEFTARQTTNLQSVTADVGVVASMVPSNTATCTPVQWLLTNFESAQGVSIPRSTLYTYYLHHCDENKLKPLPASSLGKIINKVFLCLGTRRLGRRGKSRYHYLGIRVIPGSAVSKLAEVHNLAVCQEPSQEHCKFLSCSGDTESGTLKITDKHEKNTDNSIGCHLSNSLKQDPDQHLSLGNVPGAIHDFPYIEYPPGFFPPENCTLEDLDTFRRIYREHCMVILDAVVNLKFQTAESLWIEFWGSQDNNNGDEYDEKKYLLKTKLYLLCKCKPVQQFIQRVDCLFHQILVDVLIPDVLMPNSSSVIEAIRNFANGLESCLNRAMANCPDEIIHIKISAASTLAQTLRRYSSLQHLAQTVRPVLQNSLLIRQMMVDLNNVDFRSIQDQASWVCQCDVAMVQQLEVVFKSILHRQTSLEQWAAWLNNVVSQMLKQFEGKPNFVKAAKQFLLKWSFYSSLVIRDLTLRSVVSFGYFHSIRLLYDEYMLFVIEHKVAQATGETPIAVMGWKYNDNPNNVDDFIQPGSRNEVRFFNAGREMASRNLSSWN
ncbi:hypothetical protein B7P43_G05422 [Cryptotermes secundus]|uniref:RFX-type winged-helix domain-containing protein n=1 Tax=Cryptotermes secundus TaxID=105785 RepID=A0A2J7PK49_9NEOP|nr:hypothetical protein B7P43_G05422 [Cryptotermes secundus]